jgi:hypothetical protein
MRSELTTYVEFMTTEAKYDGKAKWVGLMLGEQMYNFLMGDPVVMTQEESDKMQKLIGHMASRMFLENMSGSGHSFRNAVHTTLLQLKKDVIDTRNKALSELKSSGLSSGNNLDRNMADVRNKLSDFISEQETSRAIQHGGQIARDMLDTPRSHLEATLDALTMKQDEYIDIDIQSPISPPSLEKK